MTKKQSTMKRILIIGGGSIGDRHARCFLNTLRTNVSLSEIDCGIRERLAKAYDLTATLESLEQAFSAEGIQTLRTNLAVLKSVRKGQWISR